MVPKSRIVGLPPCLHCHGVQRGTRLVLGDVERRLCGLDPMEDRRVYIAAEIHASLDLIQPIPNI